MACGVYFSYWTMTVYNDSDTVGFLELYAKIYCEYFPEWFARERFFSCTLLTLISVGLIIAYVFLVYNIQKYFKDTMYLH